MVENRSRVDDVAEAIRSMKIRGARDIAILSVETLRDLMSSGASIGELRSASMKLKLARPSAVSLPNAVNYVLYLAESNKLLSKKDFTEKTLAGINGFLEGLNKSLEDIAEIGSRLIEDGDTVMTHCNSDTAIGVIKKAWSDGKKINAVCTESRPRHQGYLSAKMLSEHGIPTTLIIDSAVHHMMKALEVDKVIVGADTICANGDVINKIGTSQIALCAHSMDVDFIVAAESLKFSPESLFGRTVAIEERDSKEVADIQGVAIRNPGFDVTEAQYVDMIITEEGVMPPQAAYHLLKEKYKWDILKKK